jgi:transglutaminase-like putative cysteine protease
VAERQENFRRLAWTMSGLVAALVPHLLHLQAWVTVFVLAICAWRLVAERRGWRMPGTLLRGLVAVCVTAGVMLGYTTITGLDGGTALLALMSALKLLETRLPRDHAVLIFIGWFLCLASFFYAQELATVVWVLPTVWLLAAALLQVSRRGQGGAGLMPFRTTGAMLAKAAPIALVLFLFFPRLGGSFWGAPSAERAQTGLSEEMSPGDFSELALNDAIAFRAQFVGVAPPPPLRYWRGLVLSDFDGYGWSRAGAQFFSLPPVRHEGAPVDYTVVLEPTGQQLLIALDMVESWSPGLATQSWDYALRTRAPIHALLRYDARSYLNYRAGRELSPALHNHNLQLPAGRNPRAFALAQTMRAATADDAAYVQAVLDLFRAQDFYYTLTPPGLDRDSVDDFLFNTRQGFCGHYASAFTMLMRAAGIPARVVGGYQGGDWNPIGGYLIVRQEHAHAWSEIWLADSGWTRVDPTAVIAPERIARGLAADAAEAGLLPGLMRDSEFWWQAGMIWDNVNASWNDWIVQFNRLRQEELLRGLGFDDVDWREFALALGLGLAATMILPFLWLAWEFRPRSGDPAAANYRRFVRRLARSGIECNVGEAPRDFALRVRRLRPDLGGATQAITELYLRLRYLPAPTVGDLRLLRGLVARTRP